MKQWDAVKASAMMKRLLPVLVVCGGGVLINFTGVTTARLLKLPLYLDNIGIILSSVLGGYLSGIFVGFISNIINGINDPITYYYGVISVLNAVLAGYLYKKGCFGRLRGIVLTIIVLALSGGVLGSCLTWMLYGGGFGEGISSSLTMAIYYRTGWPPFCSQLCADFLMDILDKGITVGICVFVLYLIPSKWKDLLHLHGWQQAPLDKEGLQKVKKQSTGLHSFRVMIVGVFSVIAVIILAMVTSISFRIFHSSSMEKIRQEAENAVCMMSAEVDPRIVAEYRENGEEAENWQLLKEKVDNIMCIYQDVDALFIFTPAEKGLEELCRFGREGNEDSESLKLPELAGITDGQENMPFIKEVESPGGGFLLAGAEVMDPQGNRCYVLSGIFMHHVGTYDAIYLTKTLSLFAAFLILILVAGVWLADYHLVFPINSMAMAADEFLYGSDQKMEESKKRFEDLKISTGDEIENLFHAIQKTTADTVKQIEDTEKKNEAILRLQNGLILILADLVESRDEFTGNHVKNTAAYVQIIMEQMKEDGVYADELTEEWMWDMYHSAPLHDIGKIGVPDALLNKPGRLTADEFEMMKSHTVKGGKIIDRAMAAVSSGGDVSYLKEGWNVAVYHHEKWDGTGYPYGKAGFGIPLSARIMAVADVFDALVSKRSYKEALSPDTAFEIIRKGAGTQFDPAVAGAFLRAEDKLRKIVSGHRQVDGGSGS